MKWLFERCEKYQIPLKLQTPEVYFFQLIILGKIGLNAIFFLPFPVGDSSVLSMCVPLFWKFFLTEAERFLTNNFNIPCVYLLALILLQAYKVTVKIKSESSEADIDTSLFKSWAAEGLSFPWAMTHCPNEHPKFHAAAEQGFWTPLGGQACCVCWENPTCCCSRSVVCIENEGFYLISTTCCEFCLFSCSSQTFLYFVLIYLCSKMYYLKCLKAKHCYHPRRPPCAPSQSMTP